MTGQYKSIIPLSIVYVSVDEEGVNKPGIYVYWNKTKGEVDSFNHLLYSFE